MNYNTEQYFSEIPQIHAPRSVFDRSFTHKTTMDVNKLYPIFIDEALPGDTMKLTFQAFGRLVNPLVVPIMDELYFETLWFKAPMRLLWSNTFKFFGEKVNPNDSNDYVIPTINSGSTGFAVGSIFDHMGIPVNVPNKDVNALPFRFYNLAYNEWMRDQNLINSATVPMDDSDNANNYTLLKSAKMHDLFTSSLISTQLGSAVQIPVGDSAPVSVYGTGKVLGLIGYPNGTGEIQSGGLGAIYNSSWNGNNYELGAYHSLQNLAYGSTISGAEANTDGVHAGNNILLGLGVNKNADRSGLTGTADLSQATGINVNDLRFLIKLQQYREKLLTGGHRYREIISQFFNVDQLDNRAYTTEFLGITRTMIDINSVVQTSSTDSTSAQGNLTAFGVINTFESGFTTSFVEHGYLLGIARIRHNPVYQQGLNKLWTRSTALDFYNPMFNGLGEQPVLNQEIVCQGDDIVDDNGDIIDEQAFGFNEAWYEYRYYPSLITGQLRSGISKTLDVYHLAQYFGTWTDDTITGATGDNPTISGGELINNVEGGYYTTVCPVLNQSFIEENIPLQRSTSLTTSEEEGTPAFVMDFRFNYECYRPMPVRNIPAGLYEGI